MVAIEMKDAHAQIAEGVVTGPSSPCIIEIRKFLELHLQVTNGFGDSRFLGGR